MMSSSCMRRELLLLLPLSGFSRPLLLFAASYLRSELDCDLFAQISNVSQSELQVRYLSSNLA
jgi:hypothetical protein